MPRQTRKSTRHGSVYLAVLGTALIASVLAFSALALQRVQNRMLTAAADMRQAQLNAEAAIKLGLVAIKADPNWRTNYANGTWFSNRNLGAGSCTLDVTDPYDANLADSPTEPIVMTGVGSSGSAVQRVARTIDAYAEPLGCLRSSVAAGNAISLNSAVLRASNSGIVSANSVAATGATVYGRVQAVSVTGATYAGTTTQIASADLPAMPDWSTVFDYYRTNGTEIPLASLSTSTGNLGRNVGFESAISSNDWTGTPPGIPDATISQTNSPRRSGAKALQVKSRSSWYSGPAQPIDSFVKPGQQYAIEGWVNLQGGVTHVFNISIYTKGTGGSAQFNAGPVGIVAIRDIWTKVSATLVAPSWSGDLEYAFFKFAGGDALNNKDFILDDVSIRETTTGNFIYRRVLGPGVNTLTGVTNPLGLYWVNCNGSKIIIERSRIRGTLLVINPGSGSMIGPGPISWSPATPGYPALLVDADVAANADFTIAATNRSLSEAEDDVNYNPTGASHASFGTDSDLNDIYPSAIEGLVVVEDGLSFQGSALVRGSVIAGGDVTATSGNLEVEYRPDALYSPPPGFLDDPSYVSRPVSVHKEVAP